VRLATIRTDDGPRAVRVDPDGLALLPYRSVDQMLGDPAWAETAARANGQRLPAADADFAPLVLEPGKIVCVGLNYRGHIAEMGREMPPYPTLFSKFTSSLIGPFDEIRLPAESDEMDWEAELAVVIGSTCRRVSPAEARGFIAGYTVLNDVTARDWQRRTGQWLQGKTFDHSTPIGPELVTPDEIADPDDLELRCEVDGEVMQQTRTSDLLFPCDELVSYISRFTALEPGDVIATGTPAGVGAARDPKVFLQPGTVVRTIIEGVGACENRCVADDEHTTDEERDDH
jgi:acylpyruvate hydrolase